MSGLVLVVGALMLAAGGYEMFAGSGDILSERGWSAYIAGAVLVAGGVVTMAVGLALRAVDGLRLAMTGLSAGAGRLEPAQPAAGAAATLSAREPSLEQAPTAPILFAPSGDHLEPEEFHATPLEPPTPQEAPRAEMTAAEAAITEPQHGDWLDHSFAELEREMGSPSVAAAVPHYEPAPHEPSPHVAPEPEPHEDAALLSDPHAATLGSPEPLVPRAEPETIESGPIEPEPTAAEPTAPQAAIVSAREESSPPPSAVIGRYESEGTSYVMYADGSIDAQSEAGVYRFASMAELKSFIES